MHVFFFWGVGGQSRRVEGYYAAMDDVVLQRIGLYIWACQLRWLLQGTCCSGAHPVLPGLNSCSSPSKFVLMPQSSAASGAASWGFFRHQQAYAGVTDSALKADRRRQGHHSCTSHWPELSPTVNRGDTTLLELLQCCKQTLLQ